MRDASASWLLEQETRALLTRLRAVRPFALQETYVAAAAPSPHAIAAIEQHLLTGRRAVERRAQDYLAWIGGPGGEASASEQQRRFWSLRLEFLDALSQFDLFSEVITQRSESDNGILLAGLDIAAAEALLVPGRLFEGPPVVCVLHRGLGGAIRRARTRLPGGSSNPVAVIRIPRERMIGYGIASSLVHEVGHQGAALLDLVASLRAALRRVPRAHLPVWELWNLWMSEIVADFWSICRIGVGSTLGLVGLVSLPRGLVFRTPAGDPHPIPWMRVLLSCAIGDRMYPHPQWARLAASWRAMYPTGGVPATVVRTLDDLTATIPQLVSVLVDHSAEPLRGRTLGQVLRNPEVAPGALMERFATWRTHPEHMLVAPPTLAFAVLGQARASGQLSPERESRLLRRLISTWAVDSALQTARLASRPDADVFVGQPRIWREPAPRPRVLTVV